MSAIETLRAARAAGVRVAVEGTALVIDADNAPPEMLLKALRRDKSEILVLFTKQAAEDEGASHEPSNHTDLHVLTIDELRVAAGEDWPIVQDEPVVLEALAQAVANQRLREQGKPPSYWTTSCECTGCGPVYLWPGSPERFLGCPWCFNRANDLPIPRPIPVTCGTCRFFRRINHPNLGHCAKGEPEAIAGLWDSDRRGCTRWLLSEHN